MIKKILFGTMAIAISSLAFASGDAFVPAPTPDYFSGIYAGIGGGVAYTVGTLDSTMQSDTNVMLEDGASAESWVVGPLKQKSDIGKITGNGNAFIGVGKAFEFNSRPDFYVGAEIFGQYMPTSIDSKINFAGAQIIDTNGKLDTVLTGPISSSINIKNDYSFGAVARLGYLVTPKTMIYMLAGTKYAKFDVTGSGSLDLNNDMFDQYLAKDVSDIPLNINGSVSKWAFVPGIGIETMLTKCISFRAQYAFEYYSKFSITNNSSSNQDNGIVFGGLDQPIIIPLKLATTTSAKNDVNLSQGEFTVALTAHFNIF